MSRARSARSHSKGLGRVLVVEDDPILATAIQAALEDAGAKVVVCPSIACTMDALEQGAPDAIVLDVHLADRDDGWALAELVDLLGPKPPRIVFSTGTPEDIPPEIAQMGPILTKPYDPAQLVRVLVSDARHGFITRLRDAMS